MSISNIRKIEPKIKDYPLSGFKLGLAYLYLPPLDTTVSTKTLRNILQNQLDGKEIIAVKKYQIGDTIYAIFHDGKEKSAMSSFNAYLLQRGLAKIAQNVSLPPILKEWEDMQEKARVEQLGLWESSKLEDSGDDY